MADKKKSPKPTGRPKPLGHSPGLTRNRRRYDCGGKVTKKTS